MIGSSDRFPRGKLSCRALGNLILKLSENVLAADFPDLRTDLRQVCRSFLWKSVKYLVQYGTASRWLQIFAAILNRPVCEKRLSVGRMMRFVAVYGDAGYILFYHGIVQLRFCDSLYGSDRAIKGLWLPKHRYLW